MGRADPVRGRARLRRPRAARPRAGEAEGIAIYEVEGAHAELVLLEALEPARGIGTALVEALVALLAAQGVRELSLTTTNDNLGALRFYQRRGFQLVEIRPGAMDEYRKRKPMIPKVGEFGIPLRDELRLVRSILPQPDGAH